MSQRDSDTTDLELAVGQVWEPPGKPLSAKKILSLFAGVYGFPIVEVGLGGAKAKGPGFYQDESKFRQWIWKERAVCQEQP